MKMIEIKEIAKERGVKSGRLKKEDLIRAIQKGEDNPQCFNTLFSDRCGQDGCLWREDCDS